MYSVYLVSSTLWTLSHLLCLPCLIYSVYPVSSILFTMSQLFGLPCLIYLVCPVSSTLMSNYNVFSETNKTIAEWHKANQHWRFETYTYHTSSSSSSSYFYLSCLMPTCYTHSEKLLVWTVSVYPLSVYSVSDWPISVFPVLESDQFANNFLIMNVSMSHNVSLWPRMSQ